MAVPLVLALLPLASAPTNAAAKPHLQFTVAGGYQLAFKGTGWGRETRITVRFAQGDSVQHLTLISARDGAFSVGANQVDPCADFVISSHDQSVHKATLRRPERSCPSLIDVPPATLTVLTGKLAGTVRKS
jgi:hypothetical protein